ncbi:MAG: ketopantoate reductase family protein [Nocardioidaceae bacterium]
MRCVVYGAGAIGATIGGRLHESGHDVVLIARGAHGRALREHGLKLESPTASVTLAIRTVQGPDELDWRGVDVALMAMKSQDTAAAASALASAAGPDIAVVAAQNGVENERFLSRWFDHVYGMCVMCPAANLEPGRIQVHSAPVSGMLDIGRYPSGVDETSQAIAAALQRSTFLSEARPDIMRWKFRKLLMNLGNGVQALCGPSEWDDDLERVVQMLEAEANEVFAAAGISPVSVEEDRARRSDHLNVRPVGDKQRGGGSTWQSLQRGTGSVETDYLNGEIALLGRLHGIATPANATVQRLTTVAARDHQPPGSIAHADLLALLNETARA